MENEMIASPDAVTMKLRFVEEKLNDCVPLKLSLFIKFIETKKRQVFIF